MKIFLSHSSKHKPLVREIKSYLPEHLNLWLDEKELLIGDDISVSIEESIQSESDFLVFFIDHSSITSEWVEREINWALKREEQLQRKFILPLVLERDAWDAFDNKLIKNRKCLFLSDYTENSVRTITSSLIIELFAWLSRDLDNKQINKDPKASPMSIMDDAEKLIAQIADKIRIVVYPYRKSHPLDIEILINTLREAGLINNNMNKNEFIGLINRLKQQGYLAGLICDGEVIYVLQEHYAWKTSFYTETKRRLAKKAVSLIKSGDTVALDAGSTTFEIAKQICQELRFHNFQNLKIITNSIPAASELMSLASELGLEDRNNLLQVYITGGRVRPNSLAVVTDQHYLETNGVTDFEHFLNGMGLADICFVGANGIYSNKGFAVHNDYEIKTKTEIINNSKKRVIVVDPSKFIIKEEKLFLSFDETFTILTYKDGHEDEINYLNTLISNKKIEVLYG